MSKLLQHADSASHDDVAGLFQRLGDRDENRGYQDFSDARRAPVTAPAAEQLPPPVPVADHVASADSMVPAPAKATAATPSEVAAPGPTPLQKLFQRLAALPSATPGHSPLSQLRER